MERKINICVYLINVRRIHLYRQQSVYERTRKEMNLQHFEKMDFKRNSMFARTKFNI